MGPKAWGALVLALVTTVALGAILLEGHDEAPPLASAAGSTAPETNATVIGPVDALVMVGWFQGVGTGEKTPVAAMVGNLACGGQAACVLQVPTGTTLLEIDFVGDTTATLGARYAARPPFDGETVEADPHGHLLVRDPTPGEWSLHVWTEGPSASFAWGARVVYHAPTAAPEPIPTLLVGRNLGGDQAGQTWCSDSCSFQVPAGTPAVDLYWRNLQEHTMHLVVTDPRGSEHEVTDRTPTFQHPLPGTWHVRGVQEDPARDEVWFLRVDGLVSTAPTKG